MVPKNKSIKIAALVFVFSLPALGFGKKAPSGFPIDISRGDFPVEYENFGEFTGIGTENYKFKMTDRPGLRKAMGVALFPANSHSLSKDPHFKEWRKKNKGPIDPWKYVSTGNPQEDFYAWSIGGGVSQGTRLFFQAKALAEAGRYHLALKAYRAVVIHFPKEPCWSADHSFVWYPASKALSEIEAITRHNPKIGFRLREADYVIENADDTDLENDVVTVNPGRWEEWEPSPASDVSEFKIINRRGEGQVQLVQYQNRHWQMLVDNEPFFIKGVTYNPTKVGRDLVDANGSLWMHEDTNDNGWPDAPYDAWLDADKSGTRDGNEPQVGDFDLMQQMGVNAIRIYRMQRGEQYQPDEFNKKVLRDLKKRYGISVIMGDFLGAYTVGSGASWDEGTDYTDPEQLARMKNLVRSYVIDHKDEPYVLMWLLGNENLMAADYSGVNATRTNAAGHVKEYLTFVNEVAKMIHKIDPDHPVAVGNLGLRNIQEHAQYAPEVDIFGTNTYPGGRGFGTLWSKIQSNFDRPVLVTEYGCDAYDSRKKKPDEQGQADYHRAAWVDIAMNAAGRGEEGNAIGGVAFEYVDEWWKSHHGSYNIHDTERDSPMDFPDGWSSEEWLGLLTQGDGKQSPFYRGPREVFYLYKDELWADEQN